MTDQHQTTKERIIYHGAAFDRGDDFLGIDAYSGGYAQTVVVQIDYNRGTTTLNLSPEDAREFARHLVAAAEVLA